MMNRFVAGSLGVRKIIVFFFTVAALLLIPAIRLQSQTVTGTILGNVLDSSGAAVPSAQITVTNQGTGVVRTAASTAEGGYNIPSLLPGEYMVQARAQGFSPLEVKDVEVRVGSDTRVDLRLEVGQVTQQVTVTEAIPTVETTSSEVSQVMDESLIKDIPLNNRDLQQLAEIQPGVQYNYYQAYGKQLSVAGDRSIDNRYLQEGMDLTWAYRTSPSSLPTTDGVMLGVEAVKEFKVLSTDTGAEYGEMSGGVVSLLFKSGTNALHGSAYEYYRNGAFDARNFFDKTTSPPPLHRNQFGASLGGPIKKNNTFFFTNYEGYRLSQSQTFVANLPNAAARGTGNGSGQVPCAGSSAPALGGCGSGGSALATGTLVNVNVTPAIYNIFFGGANPLLPVCNGPQLGGGLCTYSSNPVETISENYGLVKLDHSFGSKNTLSGSYNNDETTEFAPVQTGANADDQYMHRQTFTLQDTHIVSTNVVNTARFGVNRVLYVFVEDLVGDPSRYSPSLFVNPIPAYTPSPFPQVPVVTVSGGMTAFGNGVTLNYAPRWMGYTAGALSDDVNYLHGNHALQFGVQYKKWDDDENIRSQVSRSTNAFQNLAQFLNGGPEQTFSWLVQSLTDSGRGWRMYSIGLYGQDTFKVKPNLTLTMGLRWEHVPGPSEEHNRISSVYNPTPWLSTAPQVGGPYFTTSKRNFSPRLGFNWDPFKKGKTSVRGGGGIFYNEIEDDNFYSGPYNTTPFATSVTISNQMPFPANLSIVTNALAAGTLKQNFGGSLPPFPKTPTKYSYNLAFQQELPDHMSVMVAYVGSQSRHFARTIAWQEYLPTAVAAPGQLPMVNGVPVTGATINPDCSAAGQIACMYWAGVGVSNANVIGNNGTLATNPTLPYATLCTSTVHTGCLINNNYGSSISGEVFDANSFYNSLQTTLERRMSPGLLARFNYTYARCITDSTDNLPGGDSLGGSAGWTPTYNHAGKRGRCSFLGTNAANFTLTYDSPFGPMVHSKLAKALVSGWQVTSLTAISSGAPFGVSDGLNVSRTAFSGAGNDRPDWAPGCDANNVINKHNPTNYFKASCFILPPYGYLGTAGALRLTGPALWNSDISLKRSFSLKREGMAVLLAADMFNAFNRTNFAAPSNTTVFTNAGTSAAPSAAYSSTAGQILSTLTTSRQFQLSGRFTF